MILVKCLLCLRFYYEHEQITGKSYLAGFSFYNTNEGKMVLVLSAAFALVMKIFEIVA